MSESVMPPGAPPRAAAALAWVGVLSSLVTVGLTVWNAHTRIRVEEAQVAIEQDKTRLAELEGQLRHLEVQSRLALDRASTNVTRFEFVHELFPALLETDATQRSLTINLVRLLLTPEEAEALFEGFSASDRAEVRSLGEQGISTLDAVARGQADRIRELAVAINSDDKPVRLAAVSRLVNEFGDSSLTVSETLAWFAPDRIDTLSPSGRINAFYVLSSTRVGAWSPELLEDARKALERVQERDAAGVAEIGPQTRESIQALEMRLKQVAASL